MWRRFVDLVEREWLDGGHQFSLRHHHVTFAPEKEKAPNFLLFLDAVWQVSGWEGILNNAPETLFNAPIDPLITLE